MTAQQLADNALVQVASARLQAASQMLQRIPLDVWRKAVIVLALFWVSHSLAKLFWVLYPVPGLPQPTTIAQPLIDDAGAGSGGINMQLLQAINLGGTEVPVAGVAAPVENQAPVEEDVAETQLSLKLQGVLESSDETRGKAIIADGNKQALYQVGELLPQGRNVKLAKVMHDKVIIENNGRFESLLLYTEEDFKGTANVVYSSGRVPIPEQRSVSRAPDDYNDAASEGENQNEGVTAQITREQLKATSINEVVRFSLHQENGQVLGYRIRPGRDRDTFEKLGLQNNDIVTSVNGIAVSDRNQLREMYKTMRTATSAQLEVNRDGAIIPITINLDTSE